VAVATGSIWRQGAIAGAIAGVVNVVIWVVGNIAGLNWEVTQGGQTTDVLAFMPFISSFVPSLLSIVLLWVLLKAGRGSLWRPIIAVLALISVAQPILAAKETSTGLVLGVMHIVFGAVLIAMVKVPAKA